MAVEIESFAHGGEHLTNDAQIARIEVLLTAAFVALLAVIAAVVFS